jgi:hypothetical protein
LNDYLHFLSRTTLSFTSEWFGQLIYISGGVAPITQADIIATWLIGTIVEGFEEHIPNQQELTEINLGVLKVSIRMKSASHSR